MERDLMERLAAWKEAPRRKPLVLNGARQVGKTWLLKEFGRRHFDNVAYVSFDNNPQMAAQFDAGYDIPRLLTMLQAETRERIVPEKTLIIFDEIQECPKALTSLKYFCEEAPECAVAAAGSLLGVTVHSGTGYPVGKVNSLDLHPLTFGEYLDAAGEGMLREIIDQGDEAAIDAFSGRLTSLLRRYYMVGGMPEVVSTFVETGRISDARQVQKDILLGYERDISKHLTPRETEFTLAAWNSIPSHLSRENKKFVFGHIKSGARARDYRSAITWMVQAGIANCVPRVSKPGVPLAAYADEGAFKLFGLDVGLLGAMTGLDEASVVDGNALFTEFKGALTEQYVCQELVALGLDPFYWSAENSTGEIDFLVQDAGRTYPIEVKSEENLRAKSLASFNRTYEGMRCRRFSLSGFREESWMRNVPLYAIGNPATWLR
jgi:predicted AAA+ superfamily ATPase